MKVALAAGIYGVSFYCGWLLIKYFMQIGMPGKLALAMAFALSMLVFPFVPIVSIHVAGLIKKRLRNLGASKSRKVNSRRQ